MTGTVGHVRESVDTDIRTGDYFSVNKTAKVILLPGSLKQRWIIIAWLFGLFLIMTLMVQLTNLNRFIDSSAKRSSFCSRNPYMPSLNTSLSSIATQAQNWLNNMDRHLLEANKPEFLSHTHDRFYPFQTMSSCKYSCVGGPCGEDQSKIMCGVEQLQGSKQCVIYSIGGNNMWDFELDLLNKTSCKIHTFDCTGSKARFHKPENDRLTFHHICLGSVSHPAPQIDCTRKGRGTICGPIKTLKDIQSMLGHTQIDLLKFDIEGYEWPIFESWPAISDGLSASFVYPMQILVEIHYETHFSDLWLPNHRPRREFRFATDIVRLQSHFLRMGYAIAVRDDNRFCKHCTELTLLRFHCK